MYGGTFMQRSQGLVGIGGRGDAEGTPRALPSDGFVRHGWENNQPERTHVQPLSSVCNVPVRVSNNAQPTRTRWFNHAWVQAGAVRWWGMREWKAKNNRRHRYAAQINKPKLSAKYSLTCKAMSKRQSQMPIKASNA